MRLTGPVAQGPERKTDVKCARMVRDLVHHKFLGLICCRMGSGKLAVASASTPLIGRLEDVTHIQKVIELADIKISLVLRDLRR